MTLQENNGIAIIDIVTGERRRSTRCSRPAWLPTARPTCRTMTRILLHRRPTPSVASWVPCLMPARASRIRSPGPTTARRSSLPSEGEANFTGGRGLESSAPERAPCFTTTAATLEATRGAVRALSRRALGRQGHRSRVTGDRRVRVARQFVFVGSERGAFVAVYRLDGGIAALRADCSRPARRPEGAADDSVARNLFVTANDGEDAGWHHLDL